MINEALLYSGWKTKGGRRVGILQNSGHFVYNLHHYHHHHFCTLKIILKYIQMKLQDYTTVVRL